MPTDPVTAGAERHNLFLLGDRATLVSLMRSAEVLTMRAEPRDRLIRQLRHTRARLLGAITRAQTLATMLASDACPATWTNDDRDALDMLFRATREALADIATSDRMAIEDAFVARAGAIPRALACELRASLAEGAPAMRAAAAARMARLSTVAPGEASALATTDAAETATQDQ